MHQRVPATVRNLTCHLVVEVKPVHKLRVVLYCLQRICGRLEVPYSGTQQKGAAHAYNKRKVSYEGKSATPT